MNTAISGVPDIWFTVHGLAAPQGSKRHVGNGIMIESSKKVKPWRQDVVAAALDAQGADWVPLDGPLHVVIEFYMPRPKGHPKTKRTVPAVTPDLSKLVRSTEDAMTTAGTIADDARIVDLTVRERYATANELIRAPHEMRSIGAKIAVFKLDAAESINEKPLLDFDGYLTTVGGQR